jgi:hypothetical protein
MIPTIISNFQVDCAEDDEALESIQRMKQLSLELGTTLHQKESEHFLFL